MLLIILNQFLRGRIASEQMIRVWNQKHMWTPLTTIRFVLRFWTIKTTTKQKRWPTPWKHQCRNKRQWTALLPPPHHDTTGPPTSLMGSRRHWQAHDATCWCPITPLAGSRNLLTPIQLAGSILPPSGSWPCFFTWRLTQIHDVTATCTLMTQLVSLWRKLFISYNSPVQDATGNTYYKT